MVAIGAISGFGTEAYIPGLDAMLDHLLGEECVFRSIVTASKQAAHFSQPVINRPAGHSLSEYMLTTTDSSTVVPLAAPHSNANPNPPPGTTLPPSSSGSQG